MCKYFLFLIFLFFIGCAVGPDYKKPAMEIPAQYKEASTSPLASPENWKPAQPLEQTSRGKWWEMFGDPQLNALEERVNVSNQTLKSSEAQYREALAIVRENRGGYYPTITATPSVSVSHSEGSRAGVTGGTGSTTTGSGTGTTGTTGTSSGTSTNYSLRFDFNYELDAWGRVRRSVESARASAQASLADLETIRLSLQAELAADYFTLRSLDAQKAILESTVQDFQSALDLTRKRHDAGIASGVDVAQAETQLETTRAQAIDVEVDRAQLEHAIAVLTGQAPATFSLPPLPMGGEPPAIPPGLPASLLERRPDVAASERRVAAANAQIGVATSAFFPNLLFNATGGFTSGSFADWFSVPGRFWSLGPSLVETIFDGERRRAVSDQAWAAYDATVAEYRQSVLTAMQDVEDNLATLHILADEAAVQEAAVNAAERSLQISNNRYEGGIVAYLEVLTAQNTLLQNRRTAVDILQRRMTASVQLIKALGGGWDANQLQSSASLR